MNSEGCKLNTISDNQRRLPFTLCPMPGLRTMISKSNPNKNNYGDTFCHDRMGIKNVINPAITLIHMNNVCLIKKYSEKLPYFLEVSASAIEDE